MKRNLKQLVPAVDRELGKVEVIRERKQAEEKVKQLQQHLQMQIDRIPIGLIVLDTELKVQSWNPAAENMFGFTAEEALGKHPFDLITPEEAKQKMVEVLRRLLNGDTSAHSINENVTKDGCNLICQWSNITLYKTDGTVMSILSMVQDITERRNEEEERVLGSQKLIRNAMISTIKAIALTCEKRDPYTAGHQHRVTQLATTIAEDIGLSPDIIEGLSLAATVHDIGKMHIPAEILSRPGRLSEAEFNMIKIHPQVGYDILKTVDFPWPIATAVLQHHERMDGSGYPLGLSGKDIIPEARVLAVADVVEAMSSHRPYRPALGIDKALEEISQNRSIRYDANIVDICLMLFREKGFVFEINSNESRSKYEWDS